MTKTCPMNKCGTCIHSPPPDGGTVRCGLWGINFDPAEQSCIRYNPDLSRVEVTGIVGVGASGITCRVNPIVDSVDVELGRVMKGIGPGGTIIWLGKWKEQPDE